VSDGRPGLHPDARSVRWNARRWPDFRPAELACRCAGRFCGGEYFHDPVFLDALQALRDRLGAPVAVNSGHRCAVWNAAIGGAPASEHKRVAADVRLAGHERAALLAAARDAGFGAFGFYCSFLHLDLRRGRRWFSGPAARAAWAPVIEREGLKWWR